MYILKKIIRLTYCNIVIVHIMRIETVTLIKGFLKVWIVIFPYPGHGIAGAPEQKDKKSTQGPATCGDTVGSVSGPCCSVFCHGTSARAHILLATSVLWLTFTWAKDLHSYVLHSVCENTAKEAYIILHSVKTFCENLPVISEYSHVNDWNQVLMFIIWF